MAKVQTVTRTQNQYADEMVVTVKSKSNPKRVPREGAKPSEGFRKFELILSAKLSNGGKRTFTVGALRAAWREMVPPFGGDGVGRELSWCTQRGYLAVGAAAKASKPKADKAA